MKRLAYLPICVLMLAAAYHMGESNGLRTGEHNGMMYANADMAVDMAKALRTLIENNEPYGEWTPWYADQIHIAVSCQ